MSATGGRGGTRLFYRPASRAECRAASAELAHLTNSEKQALAAQKRTARLYEDQRKLAVTRNTHVLFDTGIAPNRTARCCGCGISMSDPSYRWGRAKLVLKLCPKPVARADLDRYCAEYLADPDRLPGTTPTSELNQATTTATTTTRPASAAPPVATTSSSSSSTAF